MIKLWRQRFNQGKFPFIYAQLPNFEPPEKNEREIWAAFRNAQRDALKLENTAMTVNLDLGEWNDLHPLNKKDVAHRFYLAARKLAYGEDVIYSGPELKKLTKKEKQLILEFNNLAGGLKVKGEQLKGFELAGVEKKFKTVKAKLNKNQVIIDIKEVEDPKYLRYAWKDNPSEANLYNQLDLPAGTFLEKL
jgi:sialate O-acetylesterase